MDQKWFTLQKASDAAQKVLDEEFERRKLLQEALLFQVILQQQLLIESSTSEKIQVNNTTQQELNKVQHDKKILENKMSQQLHEIDNLKKKSSTQLILQKENMQLKAQISKLTSQISESKNEVNKSKQQFLTQKAVLESKLENAKKNIKNLKDSKVSVSTLNPTSLNSPIKPINKQLNKPQLSNFSVSPFLTKAKSPIKLQETPKLINKIDSSTPVNQVLAQSTPGEKSPSKVIKTKKPGSALKNLLSPNKDVIKKKKSSLFDDDDVEDDDLFGNSIKKVEVKPKEEVIKKRKKRIGTKAIVEVDDDDLQNNPSSFSPLKKVKLLDKLGGISPLKQRNTERNLFKV